MVDFNIASRRTFLKATGAASILSTRVADEVIANVSGPYVQTNDSEVRLGNDKIEVVFQRENGGIRQFRGKDTGFALRADSSFPALIWGLRFYTTEFERLSTASYLADTPTIETAQDSDEASVTLRWENPPLEARSEGSIEEPFQGIIEVEALVAESSDESRWRFKVTNEDDLAIKRTICPRITSIGPLADDGTDALYLPSRLGRKYPNPTELGFGPTHRYPSGSGTMQFASYLHDDLGIYVSAEDSEGYAKQLLFTPREENILGYRATHLVPYRPGEDVSVPYDMVLGLHSGDWKDACDRYRTWVESEGWLQDSDPTVPDRVRNRGAAYTMQSYARPESRGSQDSVSFDRTQETVENIQDRLGFPMGFNWSGWSKHGYPATGDWFPPKEGLESFENTVQSLTETGVDTFGFLNPTFAFKLSDYWTNLDTPSDLPIVDRSGEPREYTDSNVGLTFNKMEPTTPEWRDHYWEALENLIDAGVTQPQLDGVPWQWVPNCWNEAHDHPLGQGGNWFSNQIRSLLRELHTTFDIDGGLALGGEGIADFYLPHMNIHIIRDGMVEFDDPAVKRGAGEVVPMFPYTFGDYASTRTQKGHIGTYTSQRNIQRLIAGRAVAWGTVPLFMGPYEPLSGGYDDELLDYYARIGDARTGYANRFLARGTMLGKPDLDRQTVTINQRNVETETQEVRGHGWESPDGDVGVVLTNVSNRNKTRTIEVDIESQPFRYPEPPLLYVVKNGTYRAIDGTSLSLDLQPSDVALIAVISRTQGAETALERIEEIQSLDEVDEERFSAAKRAFDRHEFELAKQEATAIVENDESTTTSQQRLTQTTDSQTKTPTSTESSDTQSSVETPGFGFGTSLTALAGGGILLKWLNDGDDDV